MARRLAGAIVVSLIFIQFTPMSLLAADKAIVGYYYFWDRGSFPSSAIEYGKLTVIAHAFVVPNSDGSITTESGATWNNFLYPDLITSAHQNNVKVVVSVGGWGNSANFPALAASPTARANFASSLKAFCIQNGYNGVDIDWEYPSSSDRPNFVQMMQQLRDSLLTAGHPLSLSIAVPAFIGSGYDYNSLSSLVNWVGVMTYDYHGSWTSHSGFVSPLYDPPPSSGCTDGSANSTILAYQQSTSIPISKLFMGLAFYGYNFQSTGLYKPRTGSAPTVPYDSIDSYLSRGWTYHWDDVSKGPYLTNAANTHIITYDDTTSIRYKCDYLLNKGLGGVIIWRLGYDNIGSRQPLLETVWQNLNSTSLVIDKFPEIPRSPVILFQNYPNPFNPSTAISYQLSANSFVTLKVFDVLGREVETLANQRQNAGTYTVTFDTSKLPSGVYFYRLEVGGWSFTRSMIYLK